MIKNLSGDYETVEYDIQKYIMLYDNDDNEAYPVHWHNALEIITPLENYYIVTVGNKEFKIPESDTLIIPSGELHSMPAVKGRRIIFQCDNSVLEEFPILEQVMRGFSSPILINKDYDSQLHILAKKTMLDLLSLYKSKSELSEVKIYSMLLNMLISIRENQLMQNMKNFDMNDGKINEYSEKFVKVLKYIDNNYMYDISLDQLADIAGYSKFHFSRIFRQYNSMSYTQYINARRTKAAEQLLSDPKISITEAAMQSGFKSITTFNRIFREIKHCTPSDFRKLIQIIDY